MSKPESQTSGEEMIVADQMLAGLDLSGCKTKTEQMEAVYGYKHTGRYIREQQREKFERIMLGLSEGMAVEHISKLCGCSHNTVDALIETDFPGGRAAYDAKMLEVLVKISRQCGDKLLDLLPKCDDPKAVAVVMGIVEEKIAMRRGTPGLVTHHTHIHIGDRDAWAEKFEAIKRSALERQATGMLVEEEVRCQMSEVRCRRSEETGEEGAP